jgi:hypothetical protein
MLAASLRSAPPLVQFARPKSRILALPFGVTMMFAGLMSWWVTPSACASASASAAWPMRSTTRRGFIGRPPITLVSCSPGTNSQARNKCP